MDRFQAIGSREWEHATNIAASLCAKVAANGGSAQDALALFGVAANACKSAQWERAAQVITLKLCLHQNQHRH